MDSLDEKIRKQQWPDLVIWLILFGMGFLIFALVNPSLGLTYDSMDYLAASESADTYFSGRNPDHITYLHRPPLLPAYLYLFSDKATACWWLNLLSYATSLWLCLKIGKSLRATGFFLYAPMVVVAISLQWLQNHFFLWTEPLFTTLTLLLAYSLIEDKKLVSVIVICMAAFLLRKSGLFLGAGACVGYVVKKNMRSSAILVAVMLLSFGLWEYVIYYFSGVSTSLNILTGLSPLSRWPYADVLASWWLPKVIPLIYRLILIILFILALILLQPPWVKSYLKNPKVQLLWILSLTYVLCYIVFFGAPDYHEAERYLSVTLPLVMIVFFTFFNELINRMSSERKRKIITAGIAVWCLYPLARTVRYFFL